MKREFCQDVQRCLSLAVRNLPRKASIILTSQDEFKQFIFDISKTVIPRSCLSTYSVVIVRKIKNTACEWENHSKTKQYSTAIICVCRQPFKTHYWDKKGCKPSSHLTNNLNKTNHTTETERSIFSFNSNNSNSWGRSMSQNC